MLYTALCKHLIQYCVDTALCGYGIVCIQHCVDTALCGYNIVWIQHCVDTALCKRLMKTIGRNVAHYCCI